MTLLMLVFIACLAAMSSLLGTEDEPEHISSTAFTGMLSTAVKSGQQPPENRSQDKERRKSASDVTTISDPSRRRRTLLPRMSTQLSDCVKVQKPGF